LFQLFNQEFDRAPIAFINPIFKFLLRRFCHR
jgi:hypothetical protein